MNRYMTKRCRCTIMLFLVTVLLLAGPMSSHAAEATVDFNRTGTIRITLRDNTADHKVIKGASFQLYQVGDMARGSGNAAYELSSEFAGAGVDLTDLNSDDLAESLAAYAKQKDCTAITQKADPDGTVRFSNVPLGLYLVVQKGAVTGYYSILPFLVSVPMTSGDGTTWIYEVDASPKTQIKPQKPPSDPPKPKLPETLPQTGQLNWPIPILTMAGLLLYFMGWTLCQGKRKRETDTE